MSIPKTERLILPDEKTARRFGLLNIIFASLLLVGNLWTAGFLFAVPVSMRIVDHIAAVVTASEKNANEAEIKEWTAKAEAATTEDARQEAREKIESLQRGENNQFTVSVTGFRTYQDRRVLAYSIVEVTTGLVLNTLLLVSGAGLIGLREWGRKLAVVTAALKLVRLFTLSAVSIAVVVPITAAMMSKDMAPLVAQMKAKGGPNNPASMFINPQMFSAQGAGGVVIGLIFASIYPVLLLFQLNKARVKAACQEPMKPESSELNW